MIKEIKGDLLSCHADFICHQTNYAGVMGGGVALAIKNKLLSDTAYKAYQRLCAKKGRDLLGEVQFLAGGVKDDGDTAYIVFNLFCQDEYVQPDGGITRYDCMRKCLDTVRQYAMQYKQSVAIPGNMGCGIAGGDWKKVRSIIEDVFGNSPVPCFIVWKG